MATGIVTAYLAKGKKQLRFDGSLRFRFWKRVDRRGPLYPHMKTRCWLWSAAKNSCGYGNIVIRRKSKVAHRVCWNLEFGTIPSGLMVLHRCDDRACVRPSHLFLGTNQDNMDDMHRKGRGNRSKGERHLSAKLIKSSVVEIRHKYATGGYTLTELGIAYGVCFATIHAIVKRKTWKHV